MTAVLSATNRAFTSALIRTILTKHGDCTERDGGLEVPASVDATMMVAIGADSLAIDRVRRVQLASEYILVATHRGDSYVLLYDDLRAFRFGGGGTGAGLLR